MELRGEHVSENLQLPTPTPHPLPFLSLPSPSPSFSSCCTFLFPPSSREKTSPLIFGVDCWGWRACQCTDEEQRRQLCQCTILWTWQTICGRSKRNSTRKSNVRKLLSKLELDENSDTVFMNLKCVGGARLQEA